jgi:hypothetical protein
VTTAFRQRPLGRLQAVGLAARTVPSIDLKDGDSLLGQLTMILRTGVKRPASAPPLQIQFADGRFGALDRDSLKSLGLSESTKVPLMIAGQGSLRSAL